MLKDSKILWSHTCEKNPALSHPELASSNGMLCLCELFMGSCIYPQTGYGSSLRVAKLRKNANLNFFQVWELLQIKCVSVSQKSWLTFHSYGASLHGIFLQSVGNVKTYQICITKICFIAQNSLIPPKYHDQILRTSVRVSVLCTIILYCVVTLKYKTHNRFPSMWSTIVHWLHLRFLIYFQFCSWYFGGINKFCAINTQ